MKKRIALFMIGFFFIAANSLFAQLPELSIDSNVRKGKLANGLTYYIRHNEFPKGQADFHIVQQVGAVQENDNQNGLAHFLEHMCFNGTKHFPDKLLLTWLESKGVKFGINLNAATSSDQTVYLITNVPTKQESVVDSCLLILNDWANNLTLSTEEINKERGVIHEEWRGQTSPLERIIEKNHNAFYPNSKYGTHLIIGTMDVVDNFPPDLLRDYYKAWYRPDLQGIVVVGDIDVDKVENKIKELFEPLKVPENAPKFEYLQVADNDEPVFVSQKDKEMTQNIIWAMIKYDDLPREMRNSDAYLITEYAKSIIANVVNERINEISMKPQPPFAGGQLYFDNYLYSRTKCAANVQVLVNNKGAEVALDTLLTELKRLGQYGITQSEYERARSEFMSQLEEQYKNREKTKNDTYAQEYIDNFLNNSAIPGVEYEYQKAKTVTPMIPVTVINKMCSELFNGKNLVVLSTSADKEEIKLPAAENMLASFNKVKDSKVEPYKEDAITEPLMAKMPKAGKIVSEKKDSKLGFTELKLSNGAKVILKPTTFKDDEIVMKAVSKGGASLYGAKDYPSIAMINNIWSDFGLSKFKANDVQKLLSGKQVSVKPSVNGYEEGMSGNSTVKDLETMMQLIYLNFTEPRYDKETYETIKANMSAQVKDYSQSPQYVLQDSLVHALFCNNPKAMIIGNEMIEGMDYERMFKIYKERFSNAADFTFIFAGNFDNATMRKYIEQYIASLPSKGKKESAVNDGKAFAKGLVNKEFKRKNQNDQAMLAMVWTGKLPYTLDNKLKTSILGQLMANNLLNNVREEEGAAYSPYSVGDMIKTYDDNFIIETSFGLNPDKREKSESLTIDAIESLAKNITDTELNKMKEYMNKKFDEDTHDNNYWLNAIKDYAFYGVDTYSNYKDTVNKLTPKEMEDFDAFVLKQNNRLSVVMMPLK